MKTTSNINRIAKLSIASLTLVLAFVTNPVLASSEYAEKSAKNDIQAATERLEARNIEIENAIRFYAPEVTENMNDYFETEPAEMRLEAFVNGFEKAAVYVSPAVTENMQDLEVAEALNNLDNLNRSFEQSIRFIVPEIAE